MNHDSFALSGVIAAHEEWDGFSREIDSDILFHYFALSPSDLFRIEQCRGAVNQLGFAVQLCCLRWRGHFLADTRNLPVAVLENLAQQLGILPMQIPDYPHNHKTRSEHLERIRQHLGFSKFDESERKRLVDYIRGQATTQPRAAALYQLACRWLYQKRVVRPGQMILRKITGAAKEAALQQAYERLAGGLTPQQQAQLDALLGPATQASKQPSDEPDESGSPTPRSRLEQFKLLPRRESTGALYALILRLTDLQALRLAALPTLHQVHPAMRALLASWGYRYDAWSLGRFSATKRHAILLTFLQAALAQTVDAIVEMQDKLITRLHNNARQRREELLRTTEKAHRHAVEVLEALGSLVVDESIPDAELRARIFAHWSSVDLCGIVTECQSLRSGDDGSYLRFLASWYGYTRKFSPIFLASTPFEFAPDSALGRAVEYMREVDGQGRQFTNDAPTGFLTPRWEKYVVSSDAGRTVIARPFYELALLSTLNERIKAGEVTVSGSRRWTNFEDYLIPADVWRRERLRHYARLGLPVDPDLYIARLSEQLTAVTAAVEARLPANSALTIDAARGQFTLSALEGRAASETVKKLKDLVGIHLPRIDLVDLLIDIDNETDFLRHFISQGSYERDLNPALHRRNVLAALIAVGCNIGPVRMASASPGIALSDITYIADWCFSEEALRAAISDLINYTLTLPLSRVYGQGDTCAADGMRFYVPVNILAADYSPLLHGRGVTLLAHTSDNYLRFYHQAIPCRLREATFVLDGLLEHETELDPKSCFTDTHGYTEVVMASAALLGFELAPRIRDIKDQTLYKLDREQKYPHLDPILTGRIHPALIRHTWDEVVRVIASMQTQVVSPSLILNRLGSYARQNRIHQALAEIGRVYKTMFILRYLDDEQLRRRAGRELNKGEASHDLSRFLCFGKEGALRGRELEDQLHTFSCLAVLHNAVVAWNTQQIEKIVDRLKAEGHNVTDAQLSQTSPLMRRHINPFGRYYINQERMKRAVQLEEQQKCHWKRKKFLQCG